MIPYPSFDLVLAFDEIHMAGMQHRSLLWPGLTTAGVEDEPRYSMRDLEEAPERLRLAVEDVGPTRSRSLFEQSGVCQLRLGGLISVKP